MTGSTPRDPRLDIDPAEIAAALGITAGADYEFTDAYGVTYRGTSAHVALAALARPDRVRGIYPDQPAVALGVRDYLCLHGDARTPVNIDDTIAPVEQLHGKNRGRPCSRYKTTSHWYARYACAILRSSRGMR
ncbi:hypothetical protein [Actinokineospora iranica]|uniref:Uncharacterized protein n=1 Tax=Actinokineospora iranica TaxID=1271860 RepID=A0A1G6VSH3_9PSEU|nr:hypothetical protein [Actinokineospora iranica]SDD55776.1 hypothetical protein SAMN05216174_11339 [Actinokineospora iranica]